MHGSTIASGSRTGRRASITTSLLVLVEYSHTIHCPLGGVCLNTESILPVFPTPPVARNREVPNSHCNVCVRRSASRILSHKGGGYTELQLLNDHKFVMLPKHHLRLGLNFWMHTALRSAEIQFWSRTVFPWGRHFCNHAILWEHQSERSIITHRADWPVAGNQPGFLSWSGWVNRSPKAAGLSANGRAKLI